MRERVNMSEIVQPLGLVYYLNDHSYTYRKHILSAVAESLLYQSSVHGTQNLLSADFGFVSCTSSYNSRRREDINNFCSKLIIIVIVVPLL